MVMFESVLIVLGTYGAHNGELPEDYGVLLLEGANIRGGVAGLLDLLAGLHAHQGGTGGKLGVGSGGAVAVAEDASGLMIIDHLVAMSVIGTVGGVVVNLSLKAFERNRDGGAEGDFLCGEESHCALFWIAFCLLIIIFTESLLLNTAIKLMRIFF